MENRESNRSLAGMPSPNRMPKEWEKSTVQMTKEPAQGPMKTSRPTSRDLAPGNSVVSTGDYTRDLISQRPGAVAQRSLAPFPADVMDVLEDSGSEIYQSFCGGEFNSESPGDDGNVATGAQGGTQEAAGFATRTTGKPVIGKTLGKGTI